jgi:methylmalonyl-CoA/ethylmalonyl-CoA epimerase
VIEVLGADRARAGDEVDDRRRVHSRRREQSSARSPLVDLHRFESEPAAVPGHGLLDVVNGEHDVVKSGNAHHRKMLGSRPVIAGADLDHVAVAAERWADLRPRYVEELRGTWLGGMPEVGFAWAQVSFANGMRVELLEPHEPQHNDFLRRFLDHSGPGPHHLTFKVPDLASALGLAGGAGYRPVSVNLEHPDWKEAFLHPKDGPGVVIQLAQSSGNWASEQPASAGPATSSLDRVTHAVARLDEGMRLFEGLLGGQTVDAGEDGTTRWVDLAWPGPGRVRLVAPAKTSSPLTAWLGDRPGRVHHLAFSVPGLTDRTEVAPDDNQGVRLVLIPA